MIIDLHGHSRKYKYQFSITSLDLIHSCTAALTKRIRLSHEYSPSYWKSSANIFRSEAADSIQLRVRGARLESSSIRYSKFQQFILQRPPLLGIPHLTSSLSILNNRIFFNQAGMFARVYINILSQRLPRKEDQR